MRGFEHTSAASVAEALARWGEQPSVATSIIAGGTDLLPLMKDGLAVPARLIDIKPAGELRYLRWEDDGTLRIGALTTLADLDRDVALNERLPMLLQAVREAATPQLRTMATVGGNLLQRNRCWYFRGPMQCWLKGGEQCLARDGENKYHAIFDESPCVAVHPSDLAPALIALDAEVTLQRSGSSRTIPVAALFAPPAADHRIEHQLEPGALVAEIRVPAQPQGSRGAYLKVMDRQAWAFALVSAAAQMMLKGGIVERVRLVLGGVANVPLRIQAAEELLEGRAITPEAAAEVGARAVAGATPLAHNAFKVPMARELARRALLAAADLTP
jgi:xanthine dehydrogenase YagS FAD-binding subunit